VLILRDVLGWPARDTAALLETSVPAANSALQRARATMHDQLPAARSAWSRAEPSDEELEILAQFIDAHERQDVAATIALAHRDIRITMPPLTMVIDGAELLQYGLEQTFGPASDGDWRLVPVRANRMPAAASYLRRPGETDYVAFKFDLLRIEGGLVVEITTFGAALFPAFGLPPTLTSG
jgi:RNA polymerase sigma-70 factor (ECF subfamily)